MLIIIAILAFKKNLLVYLSIINKIKSGIINKCVRGRWRVSEIGDKCPNSMTTSVITVIFISFND